MNSECRFDMEDCATRGHLEGGVDALLALANNTGGSGGENIKVRAASHGGENERGRV